MPAESLKSKLEGNKLDLSLSSLTTVPVKELSTLPRATCLDLSCNLLTVIERDFCILTHLVELDLSKNQITELPESFGDLQKLQHLDLYQNKLTTLPLTFCRLNALKWLDIRDNQFKDGGLLAAGGNCLSDAECRNCAKQVVVYMKRVQSDHERERQKKLKEQREQEAMLKAEEEREQQRKRAEKKAEKERRRQQMIQKSKEGRLETEESDPGELADHASFHNGLAAQGHESRQNGLSCFQIVLAFLLLLVALVCGLYVYCSGANAQGDKDYCTTGMQWINSSVQYAGELFDSILTKLKISLNNS